MVKEEPLHQNVAREILSKKKKQRRIDWSVLGGKLFFIKHDKNY